MDSTRLPPLKPSASKLPIKRKTPDQAQTQTQTPGDFDPPTTITTVDFETKPPPFKFHRIWTEPDEIRFLQGLLHSSSENFAFPRDLSLFYERFSHSMSQPYTKSQLSEKLRRLRKKFRVTCSRISRGLDMSLLSAHDRSLFDISKKLWSPEYAGTSPFGNGNSNNSSLVGVKVSFSPVLDFSSCDDDIIGNDNVGDVKFSDVNVNVNVGGEGIGGVAAKSVLNVFDECLKDVRMAIVKQGLVSSDNNGVLSKEKDLQRRWKEQRVAEFDILVRRLRLVLDNSLNG